jgi:hypothetical protein
MLIANLSTNCDRPVDINNLPVRGGIASNRGSFDHLLLIDSGLLTHDEIDCLRPRVYEELARGADDDEYDTLEAAPPVRFVKVHDAYSLTPMGEPLLAGTRGAEGAIVIVRDPRDIAPSLANHSNSRIDEAIAFMNDSHAGFCTQRTEQYRQLRQMLPGWSGHLASWLGQTDIAVHLIRYEDLLADTVVTLSRALAFADHPATDREVRRAVSFADFSRLRQQELERGFREASRSRVGAQFFRRGEAGGWRDALSAEQVARIERDHSTMMLRLGYELSQTPRLARAG